MDFEQACAIAKGRNARRYRLDKAWRWIKRQNRPVKNTELGAYMGANVNTVAQILARLRRKGLVKCDRHGRHSTWTAIGNRPPECQWGMAEGSVAGLSVGWENWRPALDLAFMAKGMMPLSGTEKKEIVREFSRERAPAKSVQIPTLAQLLGVDEAA